MTENITEYQKWKSEYAKGVTVDEAANMNRADLACVWGNTLLPCMLGGDPKQLPPTVMTENEKDAAGNFLHCLAHDAKISPLLFFQASGIPVYRLYVQLQMTNGLFDMISKEVYPNVPFKYAAICNIDLLQFTSGRALEAYVREKHPEVKPSPAGKLGPIFVHYENSSVFTDDLTGSKRGPDQVKIALDLAADFVKSAKIDPASLVVLAPYAANVDLITRMGKRPEYSAILSAMDPASTVDGYQGKEGDIVIVVMGTAHPRPGPGFTSNEQRLNVMLTRQRCGLIIVGDINVTGVLDGDGKGKGKGGKGKGAKGKSKAQERFQVEGPEGQVYWTKATTLKNCMEYMFNSGRVIRVAVPPKEAIPSGSAP